MKIFFFFAISLFICGAVLSQGLLIKPGAQLKANGNVQLVLNDAGLTSEGPITPSTSTFVFSGSSAGTSFIAGSATCSFYNLTMNKTANGLQLNTDIEVNNSLSLAGGDSLFLNNHSIELGTTGTLTGEINTRRITSYNGGYIKAIATLNAPTLANPGNLGFVITSASNLGNTTIRRGHVLQEEGTIKRYYDVIPTNNSNLNASIIFNYFDTELNGTTEGMLDFFSSTDAGNAWTYEGSDGINTTLNQLTITGLSSLSRITIGNLGFQVLTLQNITLTGTRFLHQSVLNWQASGISTNGVFTIEKSISRQPFTAFETIPYSVAKGERQQFVMSDTKDQDKDVLYRIKAKQHNGYALYSNIISINGINQSPIVCNIYPNPATTQVYLALNNLPAGAFDISLYSISGKLMMQQMHVSVNGSLQIALDISRLPPGSYWIRSDRLKKSWQLLNIF